MQKINFQNLPNTTTPVNATNLNLLQTNVETAINQLIESGSNENGNYIKYDDGTLICWNRVVVSSIAITSAEGSLYKSDNITPFPDYPIQFTDYPSLSMESISDDNTRTFWVVKSQGDSLQRVRGIRIFAATSLTLTNAKLSYIAIGRWK